MKMIGSRNVLPCDGNAQRSGAGWATARDRFPGRVDRAPAGRGDGTVGHHDSVVNRRAASPDPHPQASVCAFSWGCAFGGTGSRTRRLFSRQRRTQTAIASARVRGLLEAAPIL